MPRRVRSDLAAKREVPSATDKRRRQICHVRDIEIDGYHVRIARLLNEEDPSLLSIDSYELAATRNYSATNAQEALTTFRKAREATMQTIRDLPEEQLDRGGSFAEYGPLTLRSLLHYLASHDQQHLACMHWLLGKADAAEKTS